MDTPQSGTESRFIILDNSIRSLGGHSLPYALAVLQGSRLHGYRPILVAHRDLKDVIESDIQTVRLYQYDNWPVASQVSVIRWLRLNALPNQGATALTPVHGIDSLRASLIGKLALLYGVLDRTIRARAFAKHSMFALSEIGPGPTDLLFLPNPWIAELQGLAHVLKTYEPAKAAVAHLLLRREVTPHETARLAGILRRLAHFSSKKRVFFYTDTPELSQFYRTTFGIEFDVIPIPHPIRKTALRASTKAIRISYVGDARTEKGFALLPTLVERVLAEFGSSRRINFIIQTRAPSTGREPAVAKALAKLQRFDKDNVLILTDVQSRSSYEKTIITSDIVLLPYRQHHYRFRSSGILIEALSSGTPVLVPAGTWLANELQRFRDAKHPSCHVTEGLAGAIYTSEQKLTERLIYMLTNLDDYRDVASHCADRVRAWHSAQRLVDVLVKRSRSTDETSHPGQDAGTHGLSVKQTEVI